MKKAIWLFSFLLESCALAAPDWLATAKGVAESGEQIAAGTTPETGAYVLAVVHVEPTPEGFALAKATGRRVIAGFIAGETVSVSEDSSMSEADASDGKAVETSSFAQSIHVGVDALLRGMAEVGFLESSDGVRLVLLAAEKGADAGNALREAQKELGPDVVQATGLAMVRNGDVAAAQKEALAAAQAAAIEMVLGANVAATDRAVDFQASSKVFSRAAGFLEEFRIEGEKVENSAYRVTILAKVAKDRLLKDYSAVLDSIDPDIRFCVVDTGDRLVNTLLEEKFVDWGCKLTTDPAAASYLIYCTGEWTSVQHPMNGSTGTRFGCSLRILEATTGREMLVAKNNERKSVDFVGSTRDRQKERSVEMAMKEIHGKIHEKLDRMVAKMADEHLRNQ